MRKFYFAILLSFITGVELKAQNLVPNPSFEDTVSCPTGTDQVSNCQHWISLINSPDYFNRCSQNPDVSVPVNLFGNQEPAFGDGYIGFFTYSTIWSYREIVGAYLTQSLQVGVKYFVSFKLNAANQSSNCGTNKTGLLFSTSAFNSSNPPSISNNAQIYIDSVVTDSINWAIYHFSFIADSAYSFLSLGNFFDDQNTDTLHFFQAVNYICYQLFDDLCISTDSIYCNNFNSSFMDIDKTEVKIFPNPFDDYIDVELNFIKDFLKISVYDIQGKLYLSKVIRNENQFRLQFEGLNSGIYFLKIEFKNTIKHYKLLK